ncbi:MAG TPA: phage tail tape measure protein, partial [Chloroflexi bacterium]|nr:phage tail tape measure protein [Chloroflexota bacterium]
MANDHVIDVKVRGDITGLSKGLADASSELDKAKGGFSKYGAAAADASKATQGFVEKNKANMESVGKGAAIMGGAILAGIGVAVHAYSEFAGRMAQVQSLSHASAADMDVLSKSAMTMGSAFGLSANDVADAEIELVKAGVSVKDMIGGALPGALALAAAGQIDVGKATEIATIALTQFNLKGKDVPHVADLLAAGADKALGGVSELGDGLKQGGLVASQFGLTIDDTVGTLSAFANAGLLGSDAGTSMKTMFLSLASPSKQAQAALDQYNITAYDSQGKFVGITALAGQLHDKLGNLSDAQRNAALSTIFGTDAMRSASVLMKEGSTGIQKWITDVNDQGFAAKQAAGKLDSLNGDFKKLQAAFETGLIQMGAASDGFLRPVVKGLTDAMAAFNGLPEGAKGTALAVAGVTGAGLLLGGMLLTAIPKVYDSVKAFKALSEASPRLADGIKGVGKASLIAAGLIATLQIAQAIGKNFETASKSTDEMAQSMLALNKVGAKAGDVFGKDMFKSSNGRKFVDDVHDVGVAIKQVTGPDVIDNINDFGNTVLGVLSFGNLHKDTQLDKTRESIKNLDAAMSNFVGSGSSEVATTNFKKISDEASKQGVSVETTAKAFPQYMDSLRRLASDMKVPLDQQELLNWALGQVPQKMLDAQNSTEGQAKAAEIAAKQTEAQQKALDDLGIAASGAILNLDKLVTSMIASGLITLSARDAARNFQKSIDDLDASVKANGTTLDISTEKGRANEAAFDGIAGAGLKSAEAMAKAGESQDAVQGNLHGTYDALIAAAGKFGITGDEADTMARKVMGIPKNVPIETAIQNYADTMAKAQAIKQAVDNINPNKTIYFTTDASGFYDPSAGMNGHGAGSGGASSGPKAFASGGAIDDAPGPKGVDSRLIYAAKGEHVLSDSDVDAMGGQDAVYAFRKQLHNGGVRPTYAAPAP